MSSDQVVVQLDEAAQRNSESIPSAAETATAWWLPQFLSRRPKGSPPQQLLSEWLANCSPKRINPLALLVVRAVVAIFCVAFTGLRISLFSSPLVYFKFLTNFNWIALTIYVPFALTASILARRRQHTQASQSPLIESVEDSHQSISSQRHSETDRPSWPFPLAATHQAFFVTASVMNWIVTIVYWTLLRQDFTSPKFTPIKIAATIIEHSFGLAYMLFELIVTDTKITIIDSINAQIFSVMYLLWVWIYHYGLGPEWPYFFMPLFFDIANSPGIAIVGVIVALAALVAVTAWVMFLISAKTALLTRFKL